jgi:MSHA pilin protein MshD
MKAPSIRPLPSIRAFGATRDERSGLLRTGQRGVNLIELLISIVIISIACTGVLLVFAQTVRYSADPMIQAQGLAIAEAYLDEILARPVCDPTAVACAGEPASEEGNPSLATSRPLLDDVQDYDGLSNNPPQNQNGNVADIAPVDGQPDLAGYQVDVDVTPNVNVNGVPMAQVDVRVRYGAIVDFTLTGFRAVVP